jgi:hypothetical protein
MRGQGDEVAWWVIPWLVFSLALCTLVTAYLVVSAPRREYRPRSKGGED